MRTRLRALGRIIAVAVLAGGTYVLHVRGAEQRTARLRNLNAEIEGLKLRHRLLLDDLRDVTMKKVDAEFKLKEVDAVLERMNSDIADARLLRQPIDLQIYDLNQKQHELLVSDLERYRQQAAEIDNTAGGISEQEERIARQIQDIRASSSFRAAFW